MKKKYFIVFVFITLLSFNTNLFAQSISEIVEEVEQSVVMVLTYDATGSQIGLGSGVFVNEEGKILTNAHVIEDAYSAEVISSLGNFNKVEILFKDDSKDLALIKINSTKSIPPFFAEDTEFKAGQRVIAIGNPLGLEKTVSDGLISGIRRMENGVELIQTSVPISPGSSGGVLLDEYGFVIGLTTSTIVEGQNINFAISLNTIIIFIEDYQKAVSNGTIKSAKLKIAKEIVWYRVILHRIGNIFLILISVLFGGDFYYVIPLVMLGGYILFGVTKGLWWVVYYPFRKAKERKEREAYSNYVSQTHIDDSSDYYSSPNDSDNISEDAYSTEELEENGSLEFHCPKCGFKNEIQESMRGEMINCISCRKSITVPYD